MEVLRKHFPDIIPDNEETFILHFLAIVESVDELCSLQITKNRSSYGFRIAPSIPKYTDPLIKEITKYNNIFGINLDFSKSIKTSGVIMFSINLEN